MRERFEHFRKRVGNIFQPPKARAVELSDMGMVYKKINMFRAAERCYEAALAIREKWPGPEHPDTARSIYNVAESCRADGDYPKAAALQERALAIYEKAFGPQSRDVARTLNALALLYQAMGNFPKAEALFQRALPIYEKKYGPNTYYEFIGRIRDSRFTRPVYRQSLRRRTRLSRQ